MTHRFKVGNEDVYRETLLQRLLFRQPKRTDIRLAEYSGRNHFVIG